MTDNRAEQLVSDHALVRYLERVYGLDLASVRREIAIQAEGAIQARARHVKVNGVWFALGCGRVKTVLPRRPGGEWKS